MTTSKHMWKAMRLLFLSCLLTFCAKAQATITLNVTSPGAGALAGTSLHIVVASVTSTYQIQSVTATVAARLTNLTFDATTGWIGDLSLVGLPLGPQTLSLNATDVFGNSGQTQVSFVHNLPPVLTILEPTAGSLTRPKLHVVANATSDDPGGVFIQVYGTFGTIYATATNILDTFVDLSPWDGQIFYLNFAATDSAGQTTTSSSSVYVVSSTNVVEIARVNNPIMDASADAILFFDGDALKSKSPINGAEQVLVNRPDLVPVAGFLTPHGAIFQTGADKGYEGYEVRDGTLIDLGPIYFNFIVKGNYAIWITGIYGTTPVTLTLRDLLAGTNVVITTNGDIYTSYNDVAANGDVVYWVYDDQIYRYRNGNSTYVGSGSYPITDGVNVGYVKGSGPLGDFALFDGTSETILGSQVDVPVGISRALSEGWTAWVKPGTGQTQVWTRSPYGVQTQRTFFGSSSAVYSLGPSGDLMVSSNGRLYFIPTGSGPIDLPTDVGPWPYWTLPFWSKGNWYAIIGSSLVAFFPAAPTIQSSPLTQTVEVGTPVDLWARATGSYPLLYLWYLNSTNLLGSNTNSHLLMTNLQFSQSGTYTVVVTNAFGSVTSSPAILNLISAMQRRAVPAIRVMGESGSSLHVQYTDSAVAPSSWQPLDTMTLTSPPQYWFDLSTPLPPERFYRVWQTGTPAVFPSFKLASMVPAITVSGNIGDSVLVDYINAIGPTNAWVTLDTMTLTNTSQLYFDVTAPGQPKRLYRLIQIP